MTESDAADALADYSQREVVLDLATPYVIIGTLAGADHRYLIMEEADVHDLRDSATTRELYVLDCKRHGIGRNRRRVLVRRADVVSISALEDVVE
ncbi:MAG: hypothetical protein DWQ34_10065 [Planctomycetota bacterium]|nr:MAG: hypothetical protein DWQ34_10065 [Planctomycetota bacterium]REJ95277.1 MAG: hypothetical protein DWQ29_02140 [Planctomycetota bacterium]REK21953.1 MAG: hypothetical protein DWQ41_20390 [Planctomycetota bacterium]REK32135.1 MAG: hypothetical protein DWQ45_17405 [Planctomycetota bacterium]